MAFRWRADGGPTLNVGLVAFWYCRGSVPVLLRNSIFCDFSVCWGRYGPPVPQSGSTHFIVSSGGPRLELDCCDVQTSLNLHRSICHLVQMLDTSFSLSEHFVPWIKTWVKVLNFQNIELLKIKSLDMQYAYKYQSFQV